MIQSFNVRVEIYVRKITIPARRPAGLHKTCSCFGWCCSCICSVFSFTLSLLPNTNVIFWHPSSAALHSLHKYCLLQANPDNICCGTQPTFQAHKCCEAAMVMSCAARLSVSAPCSYKQDSQSRCFITFAQNDSFALASLSIVLVSQFKEESFFSL